MSNHSIHSAASIRKIRNLFLVVAQAIFCHGALGGVPDNLEISNQADFDNIFETINSGESTANVKVLSSGEAALEKTGSGTASFVTRMRDETGQVSDHSSPIEVFADFRIVGSWEVASLGVWVGVDRGMENGWLGLVNLVSESEVRFRIFSRDSNIRSGKLGVILLDETTSVPGVLSKGNFFTVRFAMIPGPDQTKLTLSISDVETGSKIVGVETLDATPVLPEEDLAGIRCAGERVIWKNFRLLPPSE